MKANINTDGTIAITWDINAKSLYDGLSHAEMFDENYHGWATLFNMTRPEEDITSLLS